MARESFQIEKISEKRTVVQLQGFRVAIDKLEFANSACTFQLVWRLNKQRIRRSKPTLDEAVEEAKDVLRSLTSARGDLSSIPSEKLAYWQECERKLGDTPLHLAVNFYLRHFVGVAARKTVSDVVAEFTARKAADPSLSKRYTDTLVSLFKPFKREFDERGINTLTDEELDEFVYDLDLAPKSQLNRYLAIRSLFTYAQRKKYLPFGEPTALDAIEAPNVRVKTPGVLTPEAMAFYLQEADPRDIPYLAISAFGAGRRAEIERLDFEDIDYDERIIRMDTEKTKTGQRRTLDIPDNLYAWLLPYKGETGPIVTTWDPLWRLRDKMQETGQWNWPKNCLRHSFISYHLMLHRNAPLTAELAGNSVRIINETYKSLVTRASAEKWFSIVPCPRR